MLESGEKWKAVKEMMKEILRKKEREGKGF